MNLEINSFFDIVILAFMIIVVLFGIYVWLILFPLTLMFIRQERKERKEKWREENDQEKSQ